MEQKPNVLPLCHPAHRPLRGQDGVRRRRRAERQPHRRAAQHLRSADRPHRQPEGRAEMSEEWKTLRIVVELRVRGDYGETNLRWLLERMLGGSVLHQQINHFRPEGMHVETGRTRLMMWSKYIPALKREGKL